MLAIFDTSIPSPLIKLEKTHLVLEMTIFFWYFDQKKQKYLRYCVEFKSLTEQVIGQRKIIGQARTKVATHFQGMTKLSEGNTSHGIMLTRLSHQALDMLQKYRQKGSNINVNYFVHNEGQAVLQTNIGKNLKKKVK